MIPLAKHASVGTLTREFESGTKPSRGVLKNPRRQGEACAEGNESKRMRLSPHSTAFQTHRRALILLRHRPFLQCPIWIVSRLPRLDWTVMPQNPRLLNVALGSYFSLFCLLWLLAQVRLGGATALASSRVAARRSRRAGREPCLAGRRSQVARRTSHFVKIIWPISVPREREVSLSGDPAATKDTSRHSSMGHAKKMMNHGPV